MKTYSLKTADISRQWYVLDASSAPLGRLSTAAASLLIGKSKPTITPHIDNGDFVVIINSDKAVLTGNKSDKKVYHHHSGYPGGIYKRTFKEQLEKDSTKIIYDAVRGMLPVNKLRDGRLRRLKIYAGEQHEHSAQSPKPITLKKEGK